MTPVERELANNLASATRVIAVLVDRLGGEVEITHEEYRECSKYVHRDEEPNGTVKIRTAPRA